MAKRKRSHRHRDTKHLPYGMPDSKKATEWCAFDNHLLPALVDKGSINNRVKKQIDQEIEEMRHEC